MILLGGEGKGGLECIKVHEIKRSDVFDPSALKYSMTNLHSYKEVKFKIAFLFLSHHFFSTYVMVGIRFLIYLLH